MPSEQKGAYGGHLAPYGVSHGENAGLHVAYVRAAGLPSNHEGPRFLHVTTYGAAYENHLYPTRASSTGSGSFARPTAASNSLRCRARSSRR